MKKSGILSCLILWLEEKKFQWNIWIVTEYLRKMLDDWNPEMDDVWGKFNKCKKEKYVYFHKLEG